MSTLPLSIDNLANVRETLWLSQWWASDSNTKERPIMLISNFTGQHRNTPTKVGESVKEFVHLAYIFNCIAYFKGEHAKGKTEPLQWNDGLRAIDMTNAERMGICQFLKTLQCIDYNTDVRGWLTDEQYEKWERKEQYEKFHDTLLRMIHFLALHILDYDSEEYKNAKWG